MVKTVDEMLKEIEARGPDEPKSVAQYVWENGQRRGRAEGRSEGRAEGRSEGRAEGHSKGRAEGVRLGARRATVATVEGFLRAGVDWPVIESATGLDRRGFDALKEKLGSEPARVPAP